MPSENRNWSYLKPCKNVTFIAHLYQINSLESETWRQLLTWQSKECYHNSMNTFAGRNICCLSETLPSFSILYPSCSWTLSSLFLFGLVLISSLLHSVWNSKYYYPLHNFISSSASVFNSLWLHLINRECLTLLFVVMPSSYHQIQNVAKSRHYHCYSPSHISFLCSYDEICAAALT